MKKIILRTCITVLVIVGVVNFCLAKDNNGKCYDQVKQQLNAYFSQLEESKTFSGAVLIAQKGQVIFKKGCGMANYEAGIPNNPNTVFAIASLTKAFTCMSIMMLEERGLLSIEDTIADHIPDFPNGDQVTIHHLLSQSSGLFEYLYNPDIWNNIDRYHTPEELLLYFMNEPLQFEPGSRFEYSNSNYITLGNIVERVSGLPFRDFVRQNILAPLKMKHTGYDPLETDYFPNRAVGYDLIDPPLVSMYCHPSIPYTAGAMYSTVLDLFKWDQALYTERLVSKATLQKIFTPGHGSYGYAWYIDELDVNGLMHKQIWHWGAYFGFHGYISRLVNDQITVILLLNISPTLGAPDELRPIVQDAVGIVLGNH
jgi:CubicO group peptidase (beta-lactamase class C family)